MSEMYRIEIPGPELAHHRILGATQTAPERSGGCQGIAYTRWHHPSRWVCDVTADVAQLLCRHADGSLLMYRDGTRQIQIGREMVDEPEGWTYDLAAETALLAKPVTGTDPRLPALRALLGLIEEAA